MPPLTFTIYVQASRRCPDGFHELTEDDVRAVLGDDIQRITWNGFRRVLFDANLYNGEGYDADAPPDDPRVVRFGRDEIPFFEMGEIEIAGPSGTARYEESTVERRVIPLWRGGKTVYQLIAPDCSALFVMQTMWIGGRDGVWGTRNESGLETLRLDLPEGWVYRSRTLAEDLVVPLTENGTAVVLTDSASNAYSKVDGFDPAVVCPDPAEDDEENAVPIPVPIDVVPSSSPVAQDIIDADADADETLVPPSIVDTEPVSGASRFSAAPFVIVAQLPLLAMVAAMVLSSVV